jgi:hypothetical protein
VVVPCSKVRRESRSLVFITFPPLDEPAFMVRP